MKEHIQQLIKDYKKLCDDDNGRIDKAIDSKRYEYAGNIQDRRNLFLGVIEDLENVIK